MMINRFDTMMSDEQELRCFVCESVVEPEDWPAHLRAHADSYPVNSVPWDKLQRYAREWDEILERIAKCPDCNG